MKKLVLAVLLTSITNLTYAGLGETLRELRGTVSEVTSTSREVRELNKQVGGPAGASTAETQSNSSTLKSGDILKAKIANVKIYREANKKSSQLGQVSKSDELIFMGDELDGLYKVTTANGEGWVDKLLVTKR